MLHKMYSIRDSKSDVYNTPFFANTHGQAERNFQALVQDSKTTVGQYPKDFSLHYVGVYDDQSGQINPLQAPEHIVEASALTKEN